MSNLHQVSSDFSIEAFLVSGLSIPKQGFPSSGDILLQLYLLQIQTVFCFHLNTLSMIYRNHLINFATISPWKEDDVVNL